MRDLPDAELLRHLFRYDADSGRLFWENPRASNVRRGDEAGCEVTSGNVTYRTVNISKKLYRAHRIIWAMAYGNIGPDEIIDHIDRNGLNNRLENLRITTKRGNSLNAKVQDRNTSGVKGVTWCSKRQRWLSQLVVDGKKLFHKRFISLDEAIQARREAERASRG